VRTGVAITQYHLDHAGAVDNRDRDLIAALLAVSERGLGKVQRNPGSQGFLRYKRILRARWSGARNSAD
jgi:hypothetical protein